MTTRTEHDLLGERKIPAAAYWGIHTLRAVENFQISGQKISDVPQFVRSMVMVKKAAAQANGELGALKPEIATAIAQACDEVLIKGRCLDQFPSDVFQGGAGTSVNMNTNEVIANLALEALGHAKGRYDIVNPMDHVNASQSTNDAYPTGFRLAVYTSISELLGKLAHLKNTFAAKADEFKDILKMGRTQLQDAVPMTAGQEFQSFQVLLAEEETNLERTRQLLLEVNLGTTAIGTGINTPQGYAPLAVQKLSEISDLPCKLTENLIEATSDCGAYVMVHGALKRTAVKLSKICNDLRLLSSGPRAGLKEINLPEMQAGQLQLNVMEPVIAQSMFESISLLGNAAVTLADKCVRGITVNREICERYVFNSIGLVTYLNPYIGHENGDLVGKICAQTGKTVREVVLEHQLLSEAELDRILAPQNLANPNL